MWSLHAVLFCQSNSYLSRGRKLLVLVVVDVKVIEAISTPHGDSNSPGQALLANQQETIHTPYGDGVGAS